MNWQRRSEGKGGTCRAVRCRRCRRRRLMAWNTWPRCTARPSAIQPRMAAPTDAARSTRRASEPSCPGTSRGPSAPREGGGGGGGGGAVALLPELVKNPAVGTGSGGRRRRSSTRSSSIAASQRRRPPVRRAPESWPNFDRSRSPLAQGPNTTTYPIIFSKKKEEEEEEWPLTLSLVAPLTVASVSSTAGAPLDAASCGAASLLSAWVAPTGRSAPSSSGRDIGRWLRPQSASSTAATTPSVTSMDLPRPCTRFVR